LISVSKLSKTLALFVNFDDKVASTSQLGRIIGGMTSHHGLDLWATDVPHFPEQRDAKM